MHRSMQLMRTYEIIVQNHMRYKAADVIKGSRVIICIMRTKDLVLIILYIIKYIYLKNKNSFENSRRIANTI